VFEVRLERERAGLVLIHRATSSLS
jgi:hypothetical protein